MLAGSLDQKVRCVFESGVTTLGARDGGPEKGRWGALSERLDDSVEDESWNQWQVELRAMDIW